MIYLPNNRNQARTAAVTATNIVPSTAVERVSETVAGGGSLDLVGSYTGQADTVIDVEVVDLVSSGLPRVSSPAFSGVGNGAISNIDPGPLVPQVINVTCVDLGTDTRFATSRFCGVRLSARTAGAAGNDIVLRVADGALVTTPTDYATTVLIPDGAVDLEGDAFDFGHVALAEDGSVPANAPRVRFGVDPIVYRLYKRWTGERWGYNFAPAPLRAIPVGAEVQAVVGGYTVTVTDGVTTRTYADVTSVYDALAAINADVSGLVSAVDPVIVDRSPGGMATLDIWERTAPFVAEREAAGTIYVQDADLAYVPSETAPGEVLSIECVDATVPGAERWTVRGTYSGTMAPATTGVLYVDADVGVFRVPVAQGPRPVDTSRASFTVLPAARSDGEPAPCINLSRLVLGARARTREVTFTLTRRPPLACDCTEQIIQGGPNPECLGLDPDLGDENVDLHPLLESRQGRVADWLRGVAERRGGAVDGDRLVPIAEAVAADLSRHFSRLSGGTPLRLAWQASTSTPPGTLRRPVTPNGFVYRYNSPTGANGTTGASEPTWPTTIGGTVVDGGVTWTCERADTVAVVDSVLSRIEGEWRMFDLAANAASARAWVANSPYGGIVQPVAPAAPIAHPQFVAPTTANGRLYVAVSPPGTYIDTSPTLSGATQPTWPTTDYATVTDGAITWMALPRYWTASQPVTRDTVRVVGFGLVARALTTGTTDATEPAWFPRTGDAHAAAGREITDNTVTWRLERATRQNRVALVEPLPANVVGALDFAPGPINEAQYLASVRALLGPAYIAAGLRPFDIASTQGARCWRDDPSATEWWVPTDPTMLPAFTGIYYHSVRRFRNAAGEEIIEDMQEFGFGIQACGQKLGDSFTVRIDVAGMPLGETYKPGDKITLTVVRATPVAFAGGQDGNDELTWSVSGSVLGALSPYVIDRTAPGPYVDASGLEFEIGLGAIPFQLGDRFRFEVEGGRWRWRRDGGSWSTPLRQIGLDAALADGLSVAWVAGEAPSFVAADTWSFRALAVNGPQQVRRPVSGRLRTSTATTLTIAPTVPGPVTHAAICDHDIPSSATITLQASATGDFAVLTYSAVIPWRSAHILHLLPTSVTAAHWRLVVSSACEIGHVWLGSPLVLEYGQGGRALGNAQAQFVLPRNGRRRRVGVEVDHSGLSHASLETLLDALSHATDIDEGLLGCVINGAPSIVRVGGDEIAVTDLRDWQPSDLSLGRYSLRLALEASA